MRIPSEDGRDRERTNQTVICNQLKANKPGADWTAGTSAQRENQDNNSRSLTTVQRLFLWERVAVATTDSLTPPSSSFRAIFQS